jgi:hypothetical protein
LRYWRLGYFNISFFFSWQRMGSINKSNLGNYASETNGLDYCKPPLLRKTRKTT